MNIIASLFLGFLMCSCTNKIYNPKDKKKIDGIYIGYWSKIREGTENYFIKKYVFIDSISGKRYRVANIYPLGSFSKSNSNNISQNDILIDTLPFTKYIKKTSASFEFAKAFYCINNNVNNVCVAYRINGIGINLKYNKKEFYKNNNTIGQGSFCEEPIMEPLILILNGSKKSFLNFRDEQMLNLRLISKPDIIYSTCD